ncbi:MAG: ice-binding family protein [Bacteroidia bacterium]|nr:ice-binding family protein [Bacteroidia bacterium]
MKLKNVFTIIAMLLIVFLVTCKKDDETGVRPTVTSTDPLNNVTGVTRNTAVAFTFSEAMDPSTINTSTFTLMQGTTAVPGTVSYSGTTATFTPTNTLAAVTSYTATITTGAKSLTGNSLAANVVWSFTTGGSTISLAVVNLGTSDNYVILAKTAINNIPTSAVTGDMGLSPAAESYITGFALTDATGYATSVQVTGHIYAADMADPTPINLTTAVENMITAYNDAAGRPSPDFSELGTGNIGGKNLVPGLYKWTSTVTLPSDVTISGSATDIWIFQISGDLTMSSAVNITLSGGAQAKNIFWQVAGQATLGTTSHFEGIILSMTGITFQTGASINGRALAQTAVVLDANAVTKPL